MTTMNVKDAAGATVAVEKPLAPGRAAAASSRPIALSTEDKTALDLLHTDLVAATPAGTNLIGKIKTKFISAAGTALTRPANTTAYTANDAISDNATIGSVTAKSITVSDVNDDTVTLERMRLVSTDTGIQGKSVRVWLYNPTRPPILACRRWRQCCILQQARRLHRHHVRHFPHISGWRGWCLGPDEGSRIICPRPRAPPRCIGSFRRSTSLRRRANQPRSRRPSKASRARPNPQ
jgi:hypothetical protein